jgi:hypothetical protein
MTICLRIQSSDDLYRKRNLSGGHGVELTRPAPPSGSRFASDLLPFAPTRLALISRSGKGSGTSKIKRAEAFMIAALKQAEGPRRADFPNSGGHERGRFQNPQNDNILTD